MAMAGQCQCNYPSLYYLPMFRQGWLAVFERACVDAKALQIMQKRIKTI
jgi:hypothetical protein